MYWKLFAVVCPFLMLFEKDEQRLPVAVVGPCMGMEIQIMQG
jgi:hypothetical protein